MTGAGGCAMLPGMFRGKVVASLLHGLAVRDGDAQAVKDTMRQDPSVRSDVFETDINGRTVLFYAAERGDEQILWLLLPSLAGTGACCERGALLNRKDENGNLAEDQARLCGNSKMESVLHCQRMRIDFFE